jgi:8-oxo-dGTP diphosphatase
MNGQPNIPTDAPNASLSRRPFASGDAWVQSPQGVSYWGTFGAAGLLVHDPERGILLQLRSSWSHHGGTWGIPGGARHEDETPVQGALREAGEEAGVPAENLRLVFSNLLDHGFWSYTTVIVETVRPFEPRIGDAESLELRWVPVAEVSDLDLHPGFGASWERLRRELGRSVSIAIDSRGQDEDLVVDSQNLASRGIPANAIGLGFHRRWPRIAVVSDVPSVVIGVAKELLESSPDGEDRVIVVTDDALLAAEVEALGGVVLEHSALAALIGELPA